MSIVYLVVLLSCILNLRQLSFSEGTFEDICALLTLAFLLVLMAFTLVQIVALFPAFHNRTVYKLQLRFESVYQAQEPQSDALFKI